MRSLAKTLSIAVCLVAIGISSSSISANKLLIGSFTLNHPTQWKNTVLPAGNYTIKLAPTQNDSNLLQVRGGKQALDILVFAQAACETCKNGELKVDTSNGNRVITAMELPGYRMEFKAGKMSSAGKELLGKAPAASEQVAVHVDSNQ
jgi:hypothetical protein